MALSVLNNIASLTAQNSLAVTNSNLQNTLFQLSSGSRINSGADDPAGLSIADGLQANITALTQSAQNATNGVGQLQVADGALSQVTTLLNRAVTLATEAANGGLTGDQYTAITNEYSSITAEIGRIGAATNFNGSPVFQAATVTNPNVVDSTLASSSVLASTALTANQVFSIGFGSATPQTYTAGVSSALYTGNGYLSAATALTNGTTISIANAGPTFSYTAATLNWAGSGKNLNDSTALTNGDIFTVTNGTGGTTNTVSFTAGTNIQTGSSALTGSSSIAQGDTIDVYTSKGLYTYTAGASASVTNLLNDITANGGTAGISASLLGGHLVIQGTDGNGSVQVSGSMTADVGTFTGTQDTVGNLVNYVNTNGSTYGLSAYIDATGNLEVNGTAAGGNVTVAQNTAAKNDLGTLTGTQATVGNLITAINNSGDGLTATINSNHDLQVASSNGNLTISNNTMTPLGTMSAVNTVQDLMNWINGNVTGVTASLATPAGGAYQQLVITDTDNRDDLAVSSTDTALGSSGGHNAFAAPTTSGASVDNVFISDGNVASSTNYLIPVTIGPLSAATIGTNTVNLGSLNLGAADSAATALTTINGAISDVASMRGSIGAGINRLNSATNVINTQIQNLTSAQSSIQDANIGQVVANLSKYQILEQTGISALAQANQNQQAILKLIT